MTIDDLGNFISINLQITLYIILCSIQYAE